MKEPFNLEDCQKLAANDPATWLVEVREAINECINKTNTSVVSADLSEGLEITEGPLAGVPYGLKDLFDFAGVPTHNSSVFPELVDKPVEEDSELVLKLKSFGASCAAKTQMNEFAYGLSGENPHYGDCPHPRLEDCLSGGSSSGSAHMVAAGYLPLAFGTDTGGSIRVPAAWCGIYGIRWVPGYFMKGAFPLAKSFDTMGWFTRSATEMATVLKAWFDNESDPATGSIASSALIPKDLIDPEICGVLEQAVHVFDPMIDHSLTVRLETLLPECNRAFNILQSSEAYALHKGWLESQAELYDPQVKQRLLRGKDWTDEEMAWAESIQGQIKSWFENYFEQYDCLILPACPVPSIPPSESSADLREKMLRLTTPASLAGLPVLTIPVMLDEKRSVGLQFIFKEVAVRVPLSILGLCKSI